MSTETHPVQHPERALEIQNGAYTIENTETGEWRTGTASISKRAAVAATGR